ncbi:MAG TPA: hypothetical protein VLF40_05150 [Candidatus Saccharimonadales bacterium]|nr:hypothetical protein [Candidatus Saccharimonadales bacterium]
MKRTYLEEDIELIQKYFPGAKAVTVRTPFDLTRGKAVRLPRLAPDSYRAGDNPRGGWKGGILWMN